MTQSLAIPRVIPNDWKRLDLIVNKIKFRLGRDANPTFVGVTLTGLDASALIGTDTSKALESVTIGTGLDYTRPTLSLSHLGIEALTDPGADRILFWDDTASACKWLGVGNSIVITDVTIDTIQDIRTTASPTFAGLTVVNAITEFSTDGTMGGDSDSAVPTEKATKLYTDTLRSDLASTANAKGASLVGIEDSAAQFDAGDVEAALAELIVLVTPVEYNPVMSRTAGGDAGGNDASVATIDDADSYDTDELAATPGFDIQAVFTGVTDFNQVQIHTSYDGNPAHVIRIDLDKTPFNWSSFDTILADIDDNSGDFVFNAITVASAGQYINSGEVRLRFYHSSAGNATHDFFIDYCALWKTGTSVGVTEHGGLTGLLDDDHDPLYLRTDGTRALAGAWDMGSQALTNVNIDSGVITGITDLAIADGGTGQSTAQLAINALSAVGAATNEHVLTKDTGTGNAIWKVAAGGGASTFVALTDTPANYTGAAKKLAVVNEAGNAIAFASNLYWDEINDRFGLGYATPAAAIHVRKSKSGDKVRMVIENTSDTADSRAFFNVAVGGASAGDPQGNFNITGIGLWCQGADNSDDDKYKLSWNTDGLLETGTRFTITTGGDVGFGETAPETLTEWTGTAPYLTLHNSTHEDTDGGRESRLIFKGEQSGGEETTLARIEVSHDGAADDRLGKIILSVNTGAGLTQALEIGSDLLATLSGTLAVEGASVTVGKASTTTGTIVLHDSNSANTITLTVPDISAGSLSFTLPPIDGDNTNVLQTDGNGVLTWVAAGGYLGYIKLSDVKAQNTAGGAFTLGDWRTRVLNTEDSDTNNDCTLNANQITLAAGTYECHISCPTYKVDRHQARLYNTTGAAVVLVGTSEISANADNTGTRSFIVGRFTIAAGQALEVQHQCQVTKTVNGLGLEANFTSEVYAIAEFWRVS